jgi:hypothetical protein
MTIRFSLFARDTLRSVGKSFNQSSTIVESERAERRHDGAQRRSERYRSIDCALIRLFFFLCKTNVYGGRGEMVWGKWETAPPPALAAPPPLKPKAKTNVNEVVSSITM